MIHRYRSWILWLAIGCWCHHISSGFKSLFSCIPIFRRNSVSQEQQSSPQALEAHRGRPNYGASLENTTAKRHEDELHYVPIKAQTIPRIVSQSCNTCGTPIASFKQDATVSDTCLICYRHHHNETEKRSSMQNPDTSYQS